MRKYTINEKLVHEIWETCKYSGDIRIYWRNRSPDGRTTHGHRSSPLSLFYKTSYLSTRDALICTCNAVWRYTWPSDSREHTVYKTTEYTHTQRSSHPSAALRFILICIILAMLSVPLTPQNPSHDSMNKLPPRSQRSLSVTVAADPRRISLVQCVCFHCDPCLRFTYRARECAPLFSTC